MTIEEISECLDEEINYILMRLRVKNKRDVLRWLENFEFSDWLDALQILEKVTFVSEADMFTVF